MNRVQEKSAQATGVTTTSITYTGAVVAGHFLGAGGRINDNTVSVSSMSDTVNGTWQTATLQTNSGDGDWLFWNFFDNTGSGTPAVSITISSAANIQWGITEYSGLATSSPVDVKAGNDIASTTTPTTSTITTTNANDLIIGLLVGNNANLSTATNGQNSFTEWFQSNDATSGFCFSWTDKTVAATGNYSEAWSASTSMPCAGFIIALKAAGGGFTAVNRRTIGPRVGSRSYY